MYYAYIQVNQKGHWYKGHTSNITRRRVEHLLQWTPFSKRFGASTLAYFEVFFSRSGAIQREKYFKTGKGREFLAQWFSNYDMERYSSG